METELKSLIDGRVFICRKRNNIWYETKKNDKFLRDTLIEFLNYLKTEKLKLIH